MVQNNLKINSSHLLPNKPIEPISNKRFVRNYLRKELIPHKPKIELSNESPYLRQPYKKYMNNNHAANKITSQNKDNINNKTPMIRPSKITSQNKAKINNKTPVIRPNKPSSRNNKIDFDKTHIFNFSNNRELNSRNKKISTKSNKIDFDKTHIFHFSNNKIYFEKYHKKLPLIDRKTNPNK